MSIPTLKDFSVEGINAYISKIARPSTYYSLKLPTVYTPEDIDKQVNDIINQRLGADEDVSPSTKTDEEQQDTTSKIEDYIKSFDFEFIIPGYHYSGLSNQELMELFQENERDFFQDTDELRAAVKQDLEDEFEHKDWDDDTAGQTAQNSIKDFIVNRIENQGDDIDLKPLNEDYRAQKLRDGYDDRIGIRRSSWFDAIKKNGYARISF